MTKSPAFTFASVVWCAGCCAHPLTGTNSFPRFSVIANGSLALCAFGKECERSNRNAYYLSGLLVDFSLVKIGLFSAFLHSLFDLSNVTSPLLCLALIEYQGLFACKVDPCPLDALLFWHGHSWLTTVASNLSSLATSFEAWLRANLSNSCEILKFRFAMA